MDYKHNSTVEDKKLVIIIVHFEGAYVTGKGQVKFMDQPNNNNNNNKIKCFFKISTIALSSKTKFTVLFTIITVK